ncbi:hypothetical protein BZB76_1850 [Actinomadura pelletieri DSM 43383]|uniref:Uncharacterized protein n=1 Tax=Actinomadura pelletieri DSM 43383 TaxID=1120940 RepID=A0A495QSK7_9ACTN|nr:hypothetical protein [Actinomadura pelletieri]RKS76494.1 hypothetical protein BZB76_1850 [Actinomadura pelletieri DSM 43383]
MTELSHETNELVLAVLNAIVIPHAATAAHDQTRTRILLSRVAHLQFTLETLLGSACPDVHDAAQTLEEKLAEHPPIGYVTNKEARRRCAAGATWAEAVSLDYRPGVGEDRS